MNYSFNKLNQLGRQDGAALFVALIMLLALTIIGLSASQRSNLQERMAANAHVQNIAFNSAESALGGFVAEANTGDKVNDPTHIIYKLRTDTTIGPFCFNADGTRGDCGALWLDRGAAVESRMDAEVVDNCNTVMCGGFSLGSGKGGGIGVGCRIFKVEGTGTVGGVEGTVGAQSGSNSLWLYEVTACRG